MFMHIILDVVICLIFVGLVVSGVRKGLILTVASLVVVIAAAIGAGFIADQLSPALADKLEPGILGVLEENADTIGEYLGTAAEGFGDISFMGMNFDLSQNIHESVAGAAVSATESAAGFFASVLAKLIISVVAFVILLIILKLVFGALDLVAKLPVLNTLNRLGGGVVGFIIALLVVYGVTAILGNFDGLIAPETVEDTFLFRLFLEKNPLVSIFG